MDNSRSLKNICVFLVVAKLKKLGLKPEPYFSSQIHVTYEKNKNATVFWYETNDFVFHVDVLGIDLFSTQIDDSSVEKRYVDSIAAAICDKIVSELRKQVV